MNKSLKIMVLIAIAVAITSFGARIVRAACNYQSPVQDLARPAGPGPNNVSNENCGGQELEIKIKDTGGKVKAGLHTCEVSGFFRYPGAMKCSNTPRNQCSQCDMSGTLKIKTWINGNCASIPSEMASLVEFGKFKWCTEPEYLQPDTEPNAKQTKRP